MTISARERSAFGQFQLNRSAIDVGVDYAKVKKLSTADMAEMLRDGATKSEVCEAFGLSSSAVNTRLVDAGWSARDGQPLGASPGLDPEPAPDAPARIPQYQIAFVPQPWADQALCAQTDPEAWFPEKGGSTREAKAVCAGCFVQAECLDYALTQGERFGIWGGFSERERRRLTHPAPIAAVPCTSPGCDRLFTTEQGRNRHIREVHERTLLTCRQCGRIFALAYHLAVHTRAVHSDTERPAS